MGQGGQDEMHSENVCISWSKPSNYQEGLRCHAPENGRTNGGNWKIEQYSCRPETAVPWHVFQHKPWYASYTGCDMRWWWCVVQMGVATRLFHQHAVDSPPSFQSNSHFLSPRQKRGPFLVIREDILYKITQLHFCKLEAAWIFGCNQNWIQLLSSFRRLRRQILFCFWTQFRAFKSKKALALNQRCLKFNMDNQTAQNIMAKDTYVTHCRGTTFKIKNAPGANRFWYAKPTSSICTLRKWSPRKQIPGGLFEKKPFSSQRWAGCLSFRVVQLTWIGLAYQNLLRHFLT